MACTLGLPVFLPALAQNAPPKPAPPSEKAAIPEIPAQIDLLETHIRFESNGDSRKEVHATVHINSELGVRQFAHLNFDYDRSFQQVEIPLVHITHASGGTADILPSAISDQPNSAVENASAYQDVRVKSVRILGLAPGDHLEYRILTTTSHHPLAPDFWLDHSFDRTGVVSKEIFELDLPASPHVQMRVNGTTPAESTEKSGEGESARTVYRWQRSGPAADDAAKPPEGAEPDVALSTFGWETLSARLDEKLIPGGKPTLTPELTAKTTELAKGARSKLDKLEAIYDFVSQKITTIDLPVGSTGFASRPPAEILSSGYATPEDKYVLFAALSSALDLPARAALTGYCDSKGVPRPSVFTRLVISAADRENTFWLDPSLEVAPFGVLSSTEKKCVFMLDRGLSAKSPAGHEWQKISPRFPFASFQRVRVDANINQDGTLNAKVHYTMRGENELLLRVAFHQAARAKWKEVAQLLALSDGFRGKIVSASASDPYATRQPFTVEYEITQPKFVDWSKTPLRIPALLPLLGLPDPPDKAAGGAASAPIDLGTPLDVDTRVTLHLPSATSVQVPFASSVERDYATFSSHYNVQNGVITASRHINFVLRQVPASRAVDYSAFLHAVQTDQAQMFTLDRASSAPAVPAKPQPPHQTSTAPKSR
jgi:transglutaminase-like putative cysteine protease